MDSKQKFRFNLGEMKNTENNLSESNSKISVSSKVEKIKSDAPKEESFQFKLILRNKIRPNKKNNYEITDIENLENSILHNGLLQNIVVIYSLEEDMYIIESGHRRTQALDNLIKKWDNYSGAPGDPEYEEFELYQKNVAPYKKGYPCKISSILGEDIQYDFSDDVPLDEIPVAVIDSEIRLIISNEDVRNISPATRARNIERLRQLYQYKNIGKSNRDKININAQLASDTGLSISQIKNYDLSKLIPELREKFNEECISLKEASNYAKLSKEDQHQVLSILNEGHRVSADEISSLRQEQSNNECQIRDLELKIEELSEKDSDVVVTISDDDKNSEIEKLKKELSKLKKQQKENTVIFSPEQALVAKTDLAVRAAFKSCKKEIRALLTSINDLKEQVNEASDLEGMGILSDNDMLELIGKLKDMLILDEN